MATPRSGLIWMLFGLLLVAIFGRALLHREYAFFDGGETGWVPTFVPFLIGVWFVLYGLIGYIRNKNGERD